MTEAPDDRMPPWVPRAIFLLCLGLALTVVSYWVLIRLRSLLVMVLVSLFFSFAIEPTVNGLERRGWRRGLATGTVMGGAVLAGIAFVALIGSVLVDQVSNLVDEAPGYIEETQAWINDTFDADVNADDLLEQFREGGTAQDLAERLANNVVDAGATVVGLVFRLLTIGLFTFYLVADGPRLRRVVCSRLRPDHQRTVLYVWDLAIQKTGGYISSRALLAVASAVFHWIAFAVIGIPFPLPLAVWVGVVSQFVPVVGTYLAGVLPLLIAVIDRPVSALWALIAIVVYQQIENYLLAPRITAHTMAIHPAVAFGTVIAGAGLLGPVGALLALPAGATAQAFASAYMQRYDVVETEALGGLVAPPLRRSGEIAGADEPGPDPPIELDPPPAGSPADGDD